MSELTTELSSNRIAEAITEKGSIAVFPKSTVGLSEEAVEKLDKRAKLSEFEIKMLELEKQISEARKRNSEFDKLVDLCEDGILDWIDKVNAKNDIPVRTPTERRLPKYQCIKKIILPSFRISPNETSLLLEYLNYKYIAAKIVGGNLFCIKRCLLRPNLCLSTKERRYFF